MYAPITGRIGGLWMVMVCLCLPALISPSHASAVEGGGENRITVCLPSPLVSLDPTDYRDRITQMVLKNLFDSLTTRDARMAVVPQLAESWRTVNDTTWEFRLKRGVRFHNGDPFTAEDVRYTLDRVIREGGLDGRTSPRKGLLGRLAGVTVIDSHTVHIRTENPWPILPLMLTLQEMVPKRYMERVGSLEFQRKPVGTGPFQFHARPGPDRLVLKRFEGYYGGSEHNPPVQTAPLETLVFESVPLPSERIARLKRGQCDIIFNVSPGAVPILESVPDIRVHHTRPTRSYFAEINCRDPVFADPRVRVALNRAIDRRVVAENLLLGHGALLPTVLLPHAFAYHSGLQPYPYDPKAAAAQIRAGGYPMERTVSILCAEETLDFASLIAAFLTRVGLKTRIQKTPHNQPGTNGGDAGWDIFVTSWGNATLDPVGILVPKFKSDGRGNYSGYRNDTVDRLLEQGENFLDPLRREMYYQWVQEIVHREAPMIFGYAMDELYAMRNRVKNFVPPASGIINLHDVFVDDGNSP